MKTKSNYKERERGKRKRIEERGREKRKEERGKRREERGSGRGSQCTLVPHPHSTYSFLKTPFAAFVNNLTFYLSLPHVNTSLPTLPFLPFNQKKQNNNKSKPTETNRNQQKHHTLLENQKI